MGIYNVENKFWQFLNKLADVFMISLLWLLCCIPVITIGASSTACIKVVMELYTDSEGSIFKDFFREFKRCFGKATLMWILQLIILFFSYLSINASLYLALDMHSKVGWFMLPLTGMLGLILILDFLYCWPLIAYTDETNFQIIYIAARTMIGQLFMSITMIALFLVGTFIILWIPAICILIPFILIYNYAKLYARAFDRDTRLRPYLCTERIRWHLVQFERTEEEPENDIQEQAEFYSQFSDNED